MPAKGSKVVEIAPKHVEFPPKAEAAVTDLDRAVYLIDETFIGTSGRDVKEALAAAFSALSRHEGRLPKAALQARQRRWTPRRVRALWNREARRVDHYEIEDLTAVAVEEARRERQHIKTREERLAAFIASFDPSEMGQEQAEEGGRIRGMDLPRVGFTEADERADQSRGWGR